MTEDTFRKLQQCWQERAYEPMKPLLMPDLYTDHVSQLKGMERNHEINRIEGLSIDAIDLVNVQYTLKKEGREFTALITATATDYYTDDRTNERLRGDQSPAQFQEFWTFQYYHNTWLLREIEQTAESDILNDDNVFEQFTDKGMEQVAGAASKKWPELPPDTGGICIFTGRLKDFSDANPDFTVDGMMAAIPRPNQALWTYSAFWSGWLWGSEVAAPFKIGLRRRRYDWGWHTQALQAALSNGKPLLKPDAPLLGLIGELESGFLSSVLIASDLATYQLSGIALRPESNQAQISWHNTKIPPKRIENSLEDILRQAIIDYLRQRAEPAEFIHLQAAGLDALHGSSAMRNFDVNEPGQVYSQIQDSLAVVLAEQQYFVHYGGSEHTLEVGFWALSADQADPPDQPKVLPLSDRIEMECVRYMLFPSDCPFRTAHQRQPSVHCLQLHPETVPGGIQRQQKR